VTVWQLAGDDGAVMVLVLPLVHQLG